MDSAGKKPGELPETWMYAAYGVLRNLFQHGPPGNDGRYFKGSLRSYPEAVGLGVIDPRIRELIAAFNVHSVVSSISSCEGHRSWKFDARQTAFVSFSTRMALAARLAARIRLDQMTACTLHHYWMMDAAFNTDSELVFCLSCPDKRFNRRKLDADFAQLKSWAEEVFGSEQDAPN